MSVALTVVADNPRKRRPLARAPKTAAQLIGESQAKLSQAGKLADAAVEALFPTASAFEADLAAIALLPSAKVGVRERARRLAMIVQSEMECIAQIMAAKP